MKAFVVAGTHSGVGKTTIAVGLMAALRRRGLQVQPFKVGPDFLDPMHHHAATGRDSLNLDGWMLPRDVNQQCFNRCCYEADAAVIEGVMGLFDGRDGASDTGSTAEMAKILDVPVVLVLDCFAMARSAAAMVHGYLTFDPKLKFAGVILNKVGSAAHFTWLKEAIEGSNVRIPILGGVPKNADVALPERHLGLLMPGSDLDTSGHIRRLAELIEENVDLDRLLDLAADVAPPPLSPKSQVRLPSWQQEGTRHLENPEDMNDSTPSSVSPLSCPTPGAPKLARIGVAKDEAFCFYYHENLFLLREAGAELVFFSPLRDPLPDSLDGVYIGGGYPELHAKRLASNTPLLYAIRAFAAEGGVIYGECGGLMYLSREIETRVGERHEMCGVLPMRTKMVPTLKLAYCIVLPQPGCIHFPQEIGPIRGQTYHFSNAILDKAGDAPPANGSLACSAESSGMQYRYMVEQQLPNPTPEAEGYSSFPGVLASYVHLHFASNPSAASALVQCCRNRRHASAAALAPSASPAAGACPVATAAETAAAVVEAP